MLDESEPFPAPPERLMPGPAAPGQPRQRLALVVDDEAAIGALVARVLDSLGWRAIVTTAPADAEALARGVEVDLLVTDLEMPEMSGTDLAANLRRSRADLPVVLLSGWPEAATLRLDPPFAYLPKPFHLDGIKKALAFLLFDVSGTGALNSATASEA